MRYCVNYNRTFRYLHEVDEIILDYKGSNTIMSFIPELVKNKNQRIILNLDYEIIIKDIIPYINKLIKDGYNIALKIYKDQYEDCKDINIPFFFNAFCHTLEEIYMQCKQGVSDIYIVEELGFHIKDLQYFRQKYKVKFRIFPNIAQSINNTFINTIECFFVRPEDTEIYEPYIDTFELLGGEDESRLSVIYEIYKGEQWLGDLGDLILDFNERTPNKGINPYFGEMRLNCGKKCLLNKCQICEQTSILAQKFNEVGIEIVKKRKIEPKTEEQKQEIMNRLRRAEDGSGSDEETVHPE